MSKHKTIIILRGHILQRQQICGVEALSGGCVLEWIRRIGAQDRTIMVNDDPVLVTDAQRMGIRVRKAPRVEVDNAISALLREMGMTRHIECPLYMPYREDWLLQAVDDAIEANPGKYIATCSPSAFIPGDYYIDDALSVLPGSSPQKYGEEAVLVRHHREASEEILTPGDLLGARYWRDLADEVGQYPRLPENLGIVAIVGGSDSIIGSKAGEKIDACDSIVRIHDCSGSIEDFGETCDFIFGHDPERINRATEAWPMAKIVASGWPMPPILRGISSLGVTPGILNLARALTGIRDHVSTGMQAVMWALTHGASTVAIAGFGGYDHRGTIKSDYDKIWRDAEDAALDRLAGEGLVQWLD